MKKYLYLFCIFVSLFFLSSCNDRNIIQLNKDFKTVYEENSELPNFLEAVIIHDPNVTLTEENIDFSNVNMHKPGDYEVFYEVLGSNGKTYKLTVKITIISLKNLNSDLMEELEERIAKIEEFSNYYKMTMENKILLKPMLETPKEVNIKSEMFFDARDFYIESKGYWDNELLDHSIIKEKNGSLILYNLDDVNKSANVTNMGKFDEVIDEIVENMNGDSLFSNYESIIKINDNEYLVKCKINDLSFNIFNDIKSSLDVYGVDSKSYEQLIVNYYFDFYQDRNKYAIKLVLEDIPILGTSNYTDFDLNFNFVIQTVDSIIRINMANYNLSIPKTLEEVENITDITQMINVNEKPNPHYYLVHFETGQYALHSDQLFFEDITVFDSDGNLVNIGPFWNQAYVIKRSTFQINEGTYYLCIQNDSFYTNSGYSFYFEKVNYQSLFDWENPMPLVSDTSCLIEGPYDYNIYNYNSSDIGILEIVSSIDCFIYNDIYYEYGNSLEIIESSDGKYRIPICEGDNRIIISNNEASNINISFSLLVDNPDTTQDIDKMPRISTEYGNTNYAVGLGFLSDCFRLDANAPGTYKIEMQLITGNYEPYIQLFKQDSYQNLMGYANEYYLEEGIYYIKVQDHNYSVYKLRYQFTPNQTETITFNIQNYPNYTVGSRNYPNKFEYNLPTSGSTVYYQFTLIENSCIVIGSNNGFTLWNSIGEKIPNLQYTLDFSLITIPQGTYQLCFKGKESLTIQFGIGIIDRANVIDDSIGILDTPTLKVNEVFSVSKDYYNDVDLIKFVVDNDHSYKFTLGSYPVSLLDSKYQIISSTITDGSTITLTKGTYYIYFWKYISDYSWILIND